MKNVKLMLLTIVTIIYFGAGHLNAQESKSVMITTVTSGWSVFVQVIDNQDNVTIDKIKLSESNPEQLVLKKEMDKWINLGYSLSQSYGYVHSNGNVSTRYETIILTAGEK